MVMFHNIFLPPLFYKMYYTKTAELLSSADTIKNLNYLKLLATIIFYDGSFL